MYASDWSMIEYATLGHLNLCKYSYSGYRDYLWTSREENALNVYYFIIILSNASYFTHDHCDYIKEFLCGVNNIQERKPMFFPFQRQFSLAVKYAPLIRIYSPPDSQLTKICCKEMFMHLNQLLMLGPYLCITCTFFNFGAREGWKPEIGILLTFIMINQIKWKLIW